MFRSSTIIREPVLNLAKVIFMLKHQMHFFILKNIKIYIKIHINIAPTCFGLRPSSGSLY